VSVAGWPCLTATAVGCQLDVSVSPNAKRTTLDGLHDGALRVRLAAPPVDGRANQALVAWLAGELACPQRAITLRRGETSRRKQLMIDLPADGVAAWLVAHLGEPTRAGPGVTHP